jgi:DNA-directed RNA polymerase subunit N (RpoN/RPB10)
MIIPVRCFTCGKVIAHRWLAYLKKLEEKTKAGVKSPEKEILDEFGYKRYCCRRMFLSNVDLISQIN